MPADSLARHIRSLDVGEPRTVVRYDGDDYDTVHQADDLDEELTDEELEEVAKHLVLKGFDDGLEQPEFARFGHLDATVRWFHEVVVLQIPLDDWSGIIVSFDRDSISDTGRLLDEILEFVEDEFHHDTEPDEVADEFADEFAQ
ncbi:hypothetical protein [Halobacterium litoreum]|uniref:Uncharacterized protein n=1 Tax=Halobacterium litoreum TaxID=2039234 RepID=A0ABD5NIY6_9EURY|nr:hypothetical protein [Halobacterium litoreum]UHH12211.1 hypothetical protein LT972_08585 [Halobacterium litoreum]